MEYWKRRSVLYNRQRWVKNRGYLDDFIKNCYLQKSDRVLDVGTGTGIVAKTIAPLVAGVDAIDISESMLNIARKDNNSSNIVFQNMDVRKLSFESETFDKVTARMVFHHILEDLDRAILECYRVLKKPGLFLLSEGVPPDARVKARYDEIFKLKEERITFMPNDLVSLLRRAGFKKIKCNEHWILNVSIRRWLENSSINENLEKIIMLHKEADDVFKKVYNMQITSNDVFVDWKFVMVAGIKTS